ncbi:HopJ type III effector protein [Aquimarina hainanensis]|uniref:HopJ type III effector protein n=1 Tax=Aquimarina hainanensis TaxID=1578017 RepID=A0ABW5N2J2_9FLAO|nr:HopJ type III effector protein [Aquimarina sp. TRL1]QKX04591.1 HopJ type III effector protein [Aquimarina sp. TRL1]
MELTSFIEKLKTSPEKITFQETMDVVEAYYTFEPTAFTNGSVHNEQGQNSGSCKLFAFAKENEFSEEETLSCFGAYYRDDVLQHPEGDDHQNIRNFIKTGWEGVKFEQQALQKK